MKFIYRALAKAHGETLHGKQNGNDVELFTTAQSALFICEIFSQEGFEKGLKEPLNRNPVRISPATSIVR